MSRPAGVLKPTIRVVAAVIYDPLGRVLIAQRPAGKTLAGCWEFPGGKIENAESGAAALRRELLEELGFRANARVPGTARAVVGLGGGKIYGRAGRAGEPAPALGTARGVAVD